MPMKTWFYFMLLAVGFLIVAPHALSQELLKGNGSVLQIQQEMKNIAMTIRGISREEVVGRVDADKGEKILSIATTMLLRGNPGLADKIDAFFLRPDVRHEFELLPSMRTEESLSMDFFRMFSFTTSGFSTFISSGQAPGWRPPACNMVPIAPSKISILLIHSSPVISSGTGSSVGCRRRSRWESVLLPGFPVCGTGR